MKGLDKHDMVVQAIEEVKASEHQTTALKVELEAELDQGGGLDYEELLQMWLKKVESLGLAEWVESPVLGVDGYWKAKSPLMYAKFYDDHSVDCELTYTLSIEDPTTALLVPQTIDAFKEVCAEVSSYFATNKAGMHMAWLNDPDCVYPVDQVRPYDNVRFKNFRKSMIRLLPALYFLGTPNSNTRQLEYREPKIEIANHHTGYERHSPKYAAVAFARGSVEFRVFDTCYETPETVLDNIVVMCKAMQFWTRAYTRNHLPRIPKPVQFGREVYGRLASLYYTKEHLQLLEAGLNILKPDYKTVKELKAERNFTVTKKQVNDKLKDARLKARKNYEQYQKQFDWEVLYREHQYIRDELQNIAQGVIAMPNIADKDKVLAKIEKKAKRQAKEYEKARRTPCKEYIQNQMNLTIPNGGGEWCLDEADPVPPVRRYTRYTDILEDVMDINGVNIPIIRPIMGGTQ